MESADILQTVAEIAMGLAGFGGLAAGIGYRAHGEWSNDDRVRLIGMASTSLLVVFAALLPFVVHHLGIIVPWRVCAFIVLPLEAIIIVSALRVFRHGIPVAYNPLASILVLFMHVAAFAVLLVVCSNLYLGSNFGLYLLAAVLVLVVAAILFVRLLSTSFKEVTNAT
jgi:predicted lysophospholipase L1 biosynthesis ABC-type transport system permease subunit